MLSTVLALAVLLAAPCPSLEQAQRPADDFVAGGRAGLGIVLVGDGSTSATNSTSGPGVSVQGTF